MVDYYDEENPLRGGPLPSGWRERRIVTPGQGALLVPEPCPDRDCDRETAHPDGFCKEHRLDGGKE